MARVAAEIDVDAVNNNGETKELVVVPSDTPIVQRPPLTSQGSMLWRATPEVTISEAQKLLFAAVLGIYWLVLIVLYFATATFDKLVTTQESGVDGNEYTMFNHISIMIFIGFGFLMTFVRRYGYGALGYTFLISLVCVFSAPLYSTWFRSCSNGNACNADVPLNIGTSQFGLFGAAAVMISFGGVLGRVTILQLLVMAILETPLFVLNDWICYDKLEVLDVGGAMVIHSFGAYFGIACCYMLRRGVQEFHDNAASEDHNVFAMVGTLFLWIYWPSFNGALAGNRQEMAIVNTVLSIGSSTIAAFLVSAIVNRGRFDMVHVQNATLAGGVALGASADLIIQPGWSVLIGTLAGSISVVGYKWISPFMQNKLDVVDTCGIHNLHGMPGIIGAIVSMAAVEGGEQVKIQIYATLCTLGFAIVGGLIVGFLINLIPGMDTEDMFKDDIYWLGAKGAWRRARPLVRKNLADGLSGAKLDQAILKLFDEMDPEHGYVTTAELQTWLNGKTARSAAPFTPDEVREMVDEVTTDISGKGLYLQD
eukprot:CAMPEP_0177689264 /NCGR_PEP_ID=MMETSP0484_2-20121128/83_1 /TAXON_ID=354590 /ORGANISM="Rhodomonas lens, Strain RHODO" /LENGTH=536 /DNA_ID=CAMNT_0019199615 /DNA_START=26 /DNA_END=1633 /DNA_ORIENTATION=+